MLALTLAAALWNTLCNGYPVDTRSEFLYLTPQKTTVLRGYCNSKGAGASLLVYLYPRFGELLPLVGRAVLREQDGNLYGAVEDFELILKGGGVEFWAQENLDRCRNGLRAGRERLNILLMAVRVAPGKFVYTYDRAAEQCDGKTRHLLIHLLNAHIREHANDDPAICLRGLLLHAEGRFDEASKDYRAYLWNHPKDAEAFLLLAIAQQRAGSVCCAVDSARECVRLNARDVYGHVVLSVMLAANKNFEESIESSTKVIELFDFCKSIYYLRGMCRVDLKQYELAIADFTTAMEDETWHDSALHARCLVRVATGDLDGALADADELVRTSPGARSFAKRYQIHSIRNEAGSAIGDALQAIRIRAEEARTEFRPVERRLLPERLREPIDLLNREQKALCVAPLTIAATLCNDRELCLPYITYLNELRSPSRLELLARGLFHVTGGEISDACADIRKSLAARRIVPAGVAQTSISSNELEPKPVWPEGKHGDSKIDRSKYQVMPFSTQSANARRVSRVDDEPEEIKPGRIPYGR